MKIETLALNVSDPVMAGAEVFPGEISHLLWLHDPRGVALQLYKSFSPLGK